MRKSFYILYFANPKFMQVNHFEWSSDCNLAYISVKLPSYTEFMQVGHFESGHNLAVLLF